MSFFQKVKESTMVLDESEVRPVTVPMGIPPPAPFNFGIIEPMEPVDNTAALALAEEEERARISQGWKRQSDIIRRSAALSYTHSRSKSEHVRPGSSWQTHRKFNQEPVSDLQEMQVYDAELFPPPLNVRGNEPTRPQIEHRLSRRYSDEDFHAYSNPRAVPLPPPMKTSPTPSRSRSRKLTKRNNPVLSVPAQQEEEYFSSSSRDSARDSASSTTSSLSSPATSTFSTYDEQVEAKHTPVKIINFSKPTPVARAGHATKKEQPPLDISLPFSPIEEKNSDEEIKTAKSSIPTWRYEDLGTDNQLPILVSKISPTHTRNKTWGHTRKTSFGTFFYRRNVSMTEL